MDYKKLYEEQRLEIMRMKSWAKFHEKYMDDCICEIAKKDLEIERIEKERQTYHDSVRDGWSVEVCLEKDKKIKDLSNRNIILEALMEWQAGWGITPGENWYDDIERFDDWVGKTYRDQYKIVMDWARDNRENHTKIVT